MDKIVKLADGRFLAGSAANIQKHRAFFEANPDYIDLRAPVRLITTGEEGVVVAKAGEIFDVRLATGLVVAIPCGALVAL